VVDMVFGGRENFNSGFKLALVQDKQS